MNQIQAGVHFLNVHGFPHLLCTCTFVLLDVDNDFGDIRWLWERSYYWRIEVQIDTTIEVRPEGLPRNLATLATNTKVVLSVEYYTPTIGNINLNGLLSPVSFTKATHSLHWNHSLRRITHHLSRAIQLPNQRNMMCVHIICHIITSAKGIDNTCTWENR